MKLPHFFVDRPIFATVLATAVVLVGAIAYTRLPVAQYPEVVPPTVVVATAYPGASPDVIADTVSTPLEQAINGVEGMLYMQSSATNDGALQITVTFEIGTDLDQAQVQVQNRVAIAEPRLPDTVRRLGITTQKASPDLLLVAHLISPDGTYDRLYLSNYAFLRLRDALARLEGVGDVQIFGAREYSMRIWLDPYKLAGLDLTSGDVVAALREQNVQVAAGVIGQEPIPSDQAFQIIVGARGRLEGAEEFGEIVVKTGENGRVVRVDDVARVELGAVDYSMNSYLGTDEAVAIAISQRPGTNALETAQAVRRVLDEASVDFPEGVEHTIAYDPTVYVEQSIEAVIHTVFEAVILVVVVVLVFLQTWRATLVPLVAIPVSLVGTFALMAVFGFSINSLTLFGLVLAIGIVVDDAIVVVENVERNLAEGLSPRDATRKAMDEISGALVSTSLVLIAVFVPTSFLSGISGQFYRQFALTIAVSTAISTAVSLMLSPAMTATLLHSKDAPGDRFERLWDKLLGGFFRLFERVFERGQELYQKVIGVAVRRRVLASIVYAGILVLAFLVFRAVPGGFIPPQDQGYLIIAIQLPDGASLQRTDAVTLQVVEMALDTPGIENAVAFAGFSGATFSASSNAAAIFTTLSDYDERLPEGLTAEKIQGDLTSRFGEVEEGMVFVIQPPPVNGIGTGGGFKLFVQDRAGSGDFVALQEATNALVGALAEAPEVAQAFTTFRATTPRFYADVDRTKVKMLDVPIDNVFETLQTFLGSTYVNDFNFLGRTYRVTAQAEPASRDEVEDIQRLRTRSRDGAIVPLGSIVDVREISGPDRVVHYNLFPAADLNGQAAPRISTGEALDAVERIAARVLPPGFGFEWTEIAYQERQTGNTAIYAFVLAVVFVFLALAAQYESWSLPFAVILIVPLCLFSAIGGVWLRGMDNNVLTQIGLVVLVGLASKNAILIVEFARQLEDRGMGLVEAALEASRLRLRPILMTSFAFILGVLPMAIATGPGAEMRQALGTAVFFGMIGVTFFGLVFTPVFYVVVRKLFGTSEQTPAEEAEAEAPA